ncbi:MAG: diaminopimelate decarboxylase [Spirochaetaceae bacterium]|nr:diaminopimelate decarboxylase [Spirochaetaceae bacterium]|tara:strand:+ start:98794 stop:100089 length:1296 start_codon:yes stop_codon:yes gene_type:complete
MKENLPVTYTDHRLHIEDVSVAELVRSYGTPLYVYSASYFESRLDLYNRGKEGKEDSIQFCYGMKASSNLALLRLVASRGWGADIVSGGELFRCQKAGIDPKKIVFSGVGKTEEEIRYALESEIHLFSVESPSELRTISRIAAEMGKKAPVGIRINPDVDPKTHPYISTGLKENKFGIGHDQALEIYKEAASLPGIQIKAAGFHIGSQLLDFSSYEEAARRLLKLVHEIEAAGISIDEIDVGGGLGIDYLENHDLSQPLETPDPAAFVKQIWQWINESDANASGKKRKITFEPGRSVAGNSGFLITRVLYRKSNEDRQFFICDAAMNDLLRPSLYQAYHRVIPENQSRGSSFGDLVGPVCESGDFLARGRELPDFQEGDIAVLASAGAYGFIMGSNYNTRPRAAEVLVRGNEHSLIRKRETYDQLLENELL